MKSNYKIEFFQNVGICNKGKDEFNKTTVNETIDNFEKESAILKKQKLLIYFGMRDKNSLGRFKEETLGTLKIKGTAEFEQFIDKIGDENIDISYFKTFKYLIYLASNIRECDNKIYKIFTIVHELQHILQDINFRCERLRTAVLRKYFSLKGIWTNEIYRQIPTERDAFIKSKKINYRISGKKEVDTFVENKICELESKITRASSSSDPTKIIEGKKSYWENIRYLNMDNSYDLRDEFGKFWKKYEGDIEKTRRSLKEKREGYELDDNEKEFLYTYETYLNECG
jgi:hypothetical protein